MSTPELEKKHQNPKALALFMGTVGVFFVLMGEGIIPIELQENEAPAWIITVCGVIFIIAATLTLRGQGARFNQLLASILIALMGTIGAWVAFFGDSSQMSGGMNILTDENNITLGRVIFGLGALICYATAIHAFRLHLKERRKSTEN
ncbi:MAG: hypothetical protein NXI08_09950 [bacterium]|jgi:hypothetical protein|nr:hypothetical protein [bacterium]